MKAAVIGGDARFRYAAEELRRLGHTVLDDCTDECADIAIVPDAELLKGRKFGCAAVQRGKCEGENLLCLERDEEYLNENAMLTAEGALHAAMGRDACALYGTKCLVTGYGRIARALYMMLTRMGADAWAAVRAGRSAKMANAEGAQVLRMEQARAGLGEFDRIWNTVPVRIFDAREIGRIKKDALLFELASPPYGFDLHAAQKAGVRAELLSGLPGKYSPRTAGAVLAGAALRFCRERGRGYC